jgi:hypothetical protein
MSGYKLYLLQEQETGIDQKTGNGYKESGKVVLCDPQGFIVGEYDYISGGASSKALKGGKDGFAYSLPNQEFHNFGNELSRNKSEPLLTKIQPGQIEEFKVKDHGPTQEGIRFADSGFADWNYANKQSRHGLLIHEDTGVAGTLGCIGIKPEHWKNFTEDYAKIKMGELPDGVQRINNLDYSLLQMGITPKDKTPALKPSLNDIENTNLTMQATPALDQNSTFKSGLENMPKNVNQGMDIPARTI